MSLNKRAALIFVSLFLCFFAAKADALAGASFSLSPSTGVCIPGGSFDLNIILTSDEEVDGATAIINYDPSILEAVSLTNGNIFPYELVNSIDSSAGRLRFDAGVNFANPDNHTGSGTFGVIKFKVLQIGGASLSFDFTAGDTKDSNVADAETHNDVLTSTTGGSYTFEEDNTDPSLDPSCASGGGDVTPTPTPTTPPGNGGDASDDGTATPTPTPAPAGDDGEPASGGAPEGGISGPTIFISLLSLLMIGAGLIL